MPVLSPGRALLLCGLAWMAAWPALAAPLIDLSTATVVVRGKAPLVE